MTRPALARLRDYGAFGPDSVVWKVAAYPTSTTIAFQRTVAVEVMEPFVAAAVTDTGSVQYRPAMRYQRTLQYTATLIFGDSQAAVKASDMLMRIHRRIRGVEPMTGATYDSLEPESQLWIHLTEWHSLLYCYELFGPGPLSAEEDEQYWSECRTAAIYQTIDPDRIPRNRAEATAYLASMRRRLSGSEAAQTLARFIFDIDTFNEDLGPVSQVLMKPLLVGMKHMTIASCPRWMRPVMGIRQSRAVDIAAIAAGRILFRTLAAAPGSVQASFLGWYAPATYPIVAPALMGVTPEDPVVVDPGEAWAAAGRPTPREQWREMSPTRAQQTPTVKDDPANLLSFT
jgi:uncharacterized protein (DUF2236 family)